MLSPSKTKKRTKPDFVREKGHQNWWPFLFHLIDRASKSSCEFAGVVVRPEVHEIQSRLFSKHVRVKRGDINLAGAKDRNDAVHFTRQHHEVAGDRRPATTRRLKIDRGRDTHRWGYDLAIHCNFLAARHANLIDASIHFSAVAERPMDKCS